MQSIKFALIAISFTLIMNWFLFSVVRYEFKVPFSNDYTIDNITYQCVTSIFDDIICFESFEAWYGLQDHKVAFIANNGIVTDSSTKLIPIGTKFNY